MRTNNYYFTFNDIEKLEQEKAWLKQSYRAAIESDLPFSETKQIFLRLKEIKQTLEKLHQSKTGNHQAVSN